MCQSGRASWLRPGGASTLVHSYWATVPAGSSPPPGGHGGWGSGSRWRSLSPTQLGCLPEVCKQGRGEDRVPAVTHPKVILLKNQRVPRRGKERVCWPPCGPGLQRGERRGCWDAIPGPGSLSSAPAAPALPTGTGRSLLFTAPTRLL